MTNRKTVIDACTLLNRCELLLLRKARPFLPGEYSILAALEEQGGRRSSDIAELFSFLPSKASRYIKNLEERALIERVLGKKDLREFYFNITEKGREKLEALDDLVKQVK
ncbi:MAG TPA: MarR family transcriptional regulator [bacterium]|nr:MarR family transcriptional regulator [bacterium]